MSAGYARHIHPTPSIKAEKPPPPPARNAMDCGTHASMPSAAGIMCRNPFCLGSLHRSLHVFTLLITFYCFVPFVFFAPRHMYQSLTAARHATPSDLNVRCGVGAASHTHTIDALKLLGKPTKHSNTHTHVRATRTQCQSTCIRMSCS